ncbi:UDP-glycosyltransferase 90A1-like [Sesamum indicum]|uniref:Glycosyltransferase n=1 Tax=Sesamum indicum TaxID=4182 RepID=A0A6I9SRH6_SESIN|nr:UDP-glycosyltransferase 90A1-like [Sesamum indicum]
MGSLPSPHFVIFPFMSQGHTIPILYLARLLHRRSAAVTIFTTSGNSPPIHACLQDTDVSVIELPFPQNIEGIPPGVENTHKLPSMACFLPFVQSTKLMQESFEQALESLNPPVSCIISDGFLGWTLKSAKKFDVPRFVFFGIGNFSFTMYQILVTERPHAGTNSPDEPFSMPDFPGLTLTRNDFDPPYNDIEPSGPYVEFMAEQMAAAAMSHGIIVNSFYELEQCYADYWNKKIGPKNLCVGPLCMEAAAPTQALEKPSYTQFLDGKLAEGEPVLYVAFGTQAEVSAEQLQEIAAGLEQSQVSFLWTLKPKGLEFLQKFEERVKSRGIVVKDWVDQQQILRHEGVKGFLSHCGWNSVMESICAGVPILALPFMAEQHMNARFVAEEACVGLRIMPSSGSVRGFVAAEEVERKVRELMMGVEKGAEVRKKVEEYRDAACDAVKEGGSSTRTLDMLIDEVARKRQTFSSGGSAACCPDGQRFDSDHKRQHAQF